MNGASLAVLGILLPTLIHVSLFTLVFMVLGAFRSGSKSAVGAGGALSCGDRADPGRCRRRPRHWFRLSPRPAQEYFANVAPALGRLFGIPGLQLDTRLTSLLAFVYTYHYLNWFIKAEVIRWTDISRGRGSRSSSAASAASTALYFYDYAFGFTVLLALQPGAYRAGIPAQQPGAAAARRAPSARGVAQRRAAARVRCDQRAVSVDSIPVLFPAAVLRRLLRRARHRGEERLSAARVAVVLCLGRAPVRPAARSGRSR